MIYSKKHLESVAEWVRSDKGQSVEGSVILTGYSDYVSQWLMGVLNNRTLMICGMPFEEFTKLSSKEQAGIIMHKEYHTFYPCLEDDLP